MHFGHWKTESLSNKISNIHAVIKQICFQYGSAFGRWSKGLTLILMNIAGEIRRQNLRYIILFESYFNFSNKLYFGSRCMKRAYILGVITQEQHNGRSGHT